MLVGNYFVLNMVFNQMGTLLTNSFDQSLLNFFEDIGCKYIPRMLYIDLKSIVLDEVRTGIYRQLFLVKKMQHQIMLEVILLLEKNLSIMYLIKYVA
jgi:hypothetical protein